MEITCCLDFGNTQLKVAFFKGRDFQQLEVFQTLQEVVSFLEAQSFSQSILSSVLADHETNFFLNQIDCKPLILGHSTSIPIVNDYQTPETLGYDRLANACYLNSHQAANKLVIDAGTCLKFDLVAEDNHYKGGSIGPGLKMRFSALNNYTGKLPLVSFEEEYKNLAGDDTISSILSGVKIGMQEEINGMIRLYEAKYEDLTIFITGGDFNKFELKSKNTIFADQLITLRGLNEILLHNI